MQDKEEKPVLVVLPAEMVQDRSQLVPEVGTTQWPAQLVLAWLCALHPSQSETSPAAAGLAVCYQSCCPGAFAAAHTSSIAQSRAGA